MIDRRTVQLSRSPVPAARSTGLPTEGPRSIAPLRRGGASRPDSTGGSGTVPYLVEVRNRCSRAPHCYGARRYVSILCVLPHTRSTFLLQLVLPAPDAVLHTLLRAVSERRAPPRYRDGSHRLQVHHYLDSLWKQALCVTIAAAAIASILYMRVLTPLMQLRKPHTVVSVALEADRTWTPTVEPQGPWHVHFRAGQFAFLAIADSPFSLQQHPSRYRRVRSDPNSSTSGQGQPSAYVRPRYAEPYSRSPS